MDLCATKFFTYKIIIIYTPIKDFNLNEKSTRKTYKKLILPSFVHLCITWIFGSLISYNESK